MYYLHRIVYNHFEGRKKRQSYPRQFILQINDITTLSDRKKMEEIKKEPKQGFSLVKTTCLSFGIDYENLSSQKFSGIGGNPVPKIEKLFLQRESRIAFEFKEDGTIWVAALEMSFTKTNIMHTMNYVIEGLFLFGLYGERTFDLEKMKDGIEIPEIRYFPTFDSYLFSLESNKKIKDNFRKDEDFFKKKLISALFNYANRSKEVMNLEIDDFLSKSYSDRFNGVFEKFCISILFSLKTFKKHQEFSKVETSKRSVKAALDFFVRMQENFEELDTALKMDQDFEEKELSFYHKLEEDLYRLSNVGENQCIMEMGINYDATKGYDIWMNDNMFSIVTCFGEDDTLSVTKEEMENINKGELGIIQIWLDDENKYVKHRFFLADYLKDIFDFEPKTYQAKKKK